MSHERHPAAMAAPHRFAQVVDVRPCAAGGVAIIPVIIIGQPGAGREHLRR